MGFAMELLSIGTGASCLIIKKLPTWILDSQNLETIPISQIGIVLSYNWKFSKAPPPLDQNYLMVGVACVVCRPWVRLGEDEGWSGTATLL